MGAKTKKSASDSKAKKITLVDNAKKIVSNEIKKEVYQDVYKSCIDCGKAGNISVFSTCVQSLVTKIGLIVSSVVVEYKMDENNAYFFEAVNYLCKTILDDEPLCAALKATYVNENANIVKHTLDENKKIEIAEIVHQFNRLLDKLIHGLGLTTFDATKLPLKVKSIMPSIVVENNNTTKEKSKTPSKIAENSKTKEKSKTPSKVAEIDSKKLEKICKHEIALQLMPDFKIDNSAKTASGKLILKLNENSDDRLALKISTKSGKRQLIKHKYDFEKGKEHTLSFTVNHNEIKDNVIVLTVDMEIRRKQTVMKNSKITVTEGILFWKKEKTVTVPREMEQTLTADKRTVTISQRVKIK
jgi:hypothetical protein